MVWWVIGPKKGFYMRVIKNWRKAWKHYSTLALGAVVAIPSIWLTVPEELKVLIPADKLAAITAAVAALGLIGKYVDQRSQAQRAEEALAKYVADQVKEKGIPLDELAKVLSQKAE